MASPQHRAAPGRRPVPPVRALVAAALLWPFVHACPAQPPEGGAPERERSNVLVVTLDTTRADRLGCYGHAGARTPSLDALARAGVLFESAYTPSVLTLPSHATIFTGMLPPSHGVRDNGTDRLADSALTLAEILGREGYRTGAFVSSAVVEAMFGLDQGFDTYDDTTVKEQRHTVRYAERDAGAVTDAALEWLAAGAGEPWLLWVHYFDPHAPYSPPPPLSGDFEGREYDGEIAWVDSNLGRLLEAVKAGSPDTLVVVVGDHGEGLGDHGEPTHGIFLYEEMVRVPLILSAPGRLPEGARIGHVVRTTDLLPTILDLLSLDRPDGLEGISLGPLIGGAAPEAELPAYAEAIFPATMYGWSPLASLRVGRWKYVHAPGPELYDLASDPGERRDLSSERGGKAEEMLGRLEEILKAARAGGPPERVRLDPDQQAILRSLGYVDGGDLSLRQELDADPLALLSGGERGLRDPKNQTALMERIQEALRAYGQGHLELAVELTRGILTDSPDSNFVRLYLAAAYRRLERLEPALAEYRSILARQPENLDAWIGAGWALMRMERYGEARAAFGKVLALNPRHTDALSSLASIHFIEGSFDEAETLFTRVLEQRPGDIRTVLTLAQIAQARGRDDEAERLFRRALEAEPADLNAEIGLALLQFRTSRPEEALRTLAEAEAHHPDRAEISVARGNVLMGMERLEEAARAFREAVARAPDAAQGYHGLGLLAARRGDLAEARRLFERALSADPRFGEAREALARLAGP